MKGKVCMVTGATSGIGAATAEALARHGATVVIVGRDAGRCAAAAERLRRESGHDAVAWLRADLSSQAEVRELARQFLDRHDRLDVLVNNAGGMFYRRAESVDGIEMTFALNHLSYYLLTNLLLDALKASAPARVVNVASIGHLIAPGIHFADPQFRRGYRIGWRAYFQSKLANLMFTYELARRLEGAGVTVNALHPGRVETHFGQNNGPIWYWLKAIHDFVLRVKYLTPEEGARTVIYLATSPEVEGITGQYFADEKAVASSPASRDEVAASRLWQLSEQLTALPAAARI